ncbi:30S ribosomal protein S9 [Candidatus Saganbacteria bacterium]|uniref:Small ribosomal subunit protein uS9 n=1 Tax=Candidatus Saganbacteria bacterium TaxID=2575572 RepID=A0A9D6UM98_UNCSA|nr:30S ribosomal protein S9 [Candidatus Saganbacteria bacterium]
MEEKKAAIKRKKAGVETAAPGQEKYYGTGRRKEAVAKVWLRPGSGRILLNARPAVEYFCSRKALEFQVNRPLVTTQTLGRYDVEATIYGGGVPGQAWAVSMGIARALVQLNPDFKPLLKREGLLTRDPRMKERKKYGLKRARRAFQYSKR